MDEPRPAGVNAHPGAASRRGLTRQNLILGGGIRGAALLLVVLTPVVAARTLDTSGVAQVMIAVSVATMIGVVGQVGLPFVISLRVAQVRAGVISSALLRGNLRSACLFLLALTGLLLLLAAPPWGVPPGWIVPNATRGMLVAIALAGVGRAASRIFSETNKGYGGVNIAVVGSDLLGPGLGLVVVLVAGVAFGAMTTSEAFAWALAVGWVLAVGTAVWMAPVKPSFARVQHAAEYRLRHGMVVLGVVSVLNVGIQQAHIIISGYALGLADAGVFSAAARLATLTGAPLMIISSIASPDIGLALQSDDPSQLKRVEMRLRRLTGACFMGGAVLALGYLVGGATLLRVLFGQEYASGHAELVILSIGPLASLFTGVAGLCLMLAGERVRLMRDTVVGSTLAVVSMFVGAIYFGGVGLAVGYTLGQTVVNVMLLRSCRHVVGMTPIAHPMAVFRRS